MTLPSKPADMPVPLDPLHPPPLGQYCDLVLKGGVVDGVIYPGVLIELARHYRFQGIAGTSVGAIAASLAAASEYARRFGSDDGFNEVLRKIPDELASPPEADLPVTKLRTLFQPDKKLARLFNVFVEVTSVPMAELKAKLMCIIWSSYQYAFFKGFLIAEAVALFLNLPFKALYNCLLTLCYPGIMALSLHGLVDKLVWKLLTVSLGVGLLAGLIVGAVFMVWAIWRDYKNLAEAKGFGFCSGMSEDSGKTEGLTEWLHKGIQGAAKMPLNRPLTFQDLWDAPGGPHDAYGRQVQKSIDLRMISTALSHGRPYEFPMEDPSTRLFFKVSELERYFPESITAHMRKFARRYTGADVEKLYSLDLDKYPDNLRDPYPDDVNPDDFRILPVGDLPVLVAVRLSMNFPVLFQAVPLWSVDAEAGPTRTPRPVWAPKFRKTWFTDGGVTANFPIHIFDAPVPSWPTFGIFIAEKSRSSNFLYKESPLTFLPPFHTVGREEKWTEIKDSDDGNNASNVLTSGFGTYLKSIVFTAKDWADNANMRMPGIRDRVVTVYKNGEKNGGLNLNLEPAKIRNLGSRNGVEAGRKLVNRFLTDSAVQNPYLDGTRGWLDHRWVRFNAYVSALKVHLTGFSAAVNAAQGTSSISTQIEQAKDVAPLKFDKYFEPTLSEAQAHALKRAVHAVQALEAAMDADKVVQPYIPKPQPELKSRARI